MDIDKAITEIEQADRQITSLRSFINGKRASIAKHLCPFVEGQRVLNGSGDEEIVFKILPCSYRPFYKLKCFKIKKNGDPYVYSYEPWGCDNYRASE